MLIQKLLIVAALWLCTGFAYAQEDDGTLSTGVGNFEFTSEILLTPLDQDLNVRSEATGILSIKGQAISVFKVDSETVYLRILNYAPKALNDFIHKNRETAMDQWEWGSYQADAASAKFLLYNWGSTRDKYTKFVLDGNFYTVLGEYQALFGVDKAAFEASAQAKVLRKTSVEVGAAVLPFKWRFQEGQKDFSGETNLAVMLGIKLPHYEQKKWHTSLMIGYSVGEADLDSISVNKNFADLRDRDDFLTHTFTAGVMLEYDRVQAGVFMGWDHLQRTAQEQFNWDYQGRPWLSLAFGYSIFTRESQEKKSTDQKEGKSDFNKRFF